MQVHTYTDMYMLHIYTHMQTRKRIRSMHRSQGKDAGHILFVHRPPSRINWAWSQGHQDIQIPSQGCFDTQGQLQGAEDWSNVVAARGSCNHLLGGCDLAQGKAVDKAILCIACAPDLFPSAKQLHEENSASPLCAMELYLSCKQKRS